MKNFYIEDLRKTVRKIEDKVSDISDTLKDLSMKLSHIIRSKKSYQDMLEGNDYPA